MNSSTQRNPSDDIELVGADWVVRIAPSHGGRIAQIAFRGVDLLVDDIDRTPSRELSWGCYPMVPWAGRLRNASFEHAGTVHTMPANEPPHSLHGLGFSRAWSISSLTSSNESSSATMHIDLSSQSPFHGECVHDVTVDDNGVHARLTMRSFGGEFPAMVGWHPWFSRALSHESSFDAMLARDSDNIVTTSRTAMSQQPLSGTYDDCFVDARRAPRLRHTDFAVDVESDCSHWMVYTEPTHAFCLEPMSGPPNCLGESHPDRTVVTPSRPLCRNLSFRLAGRTGG